jgi:Tfp pilus assembly PilM family ATPase
VNLPVVARAARETAGLASRLVTWLREPERPLLGIEVRAGSLAALRLARGQGQRTIAAAAVVRLGDGVVQPSMNRANVTDAAALRSTLHQLIERVGGLTERRVAIALPDSVARIVVLTDADAGTARGAAMGDLVRFRLREKVPFDIREAFVASEVVSAANGASPSALVCVAVLRSVIEEYEAVVASLGPVPGLVEVSGLALLRSLRPSQAAADWLTLNWDEDHLSLFLTRDGVPLLARTVLGRIDADSVGRELSNTILYHSERLGGKGLSGVRLRSAQLPASEASEQVMRILGVAPTLIDPLADLGGGAPSTEVGQALAGIACVLSAFQA